jgi:hypothetical protein
MEFPLCRTFGNVVGVNQRNKVKLNKYNVVNASSEPWSVFGVNAAHALQSYIWDVRAVTGLASLPKRLKPRAVVLAGQPTMRVSVAKA